MNAAHAKGRRPRVEVVPPALPRAAAVPAGWRALATGWRDTRLFRVTLPDGGVHWEATMRLRGELIRHRFASELHARAWLLDANGSAPSQNPFDLEELHEGYRTAFHLRGGKAIG